MQGKKPCVYVFEIQSRHVDLIDEKKKMKLDPMQDVKKYLKEKSKHGQKDKEKKKKRKHREIVSFYRCEKVFCFI